MKYFLKKTNLAKGEYLQIYQSEYSREKGSRNKCFKTLGYVIDLKNKGIDDPIAKAKAQVDKLNKVLIKNEKQNRAKKIGSLSPERFTGYFVLKAIANSLPSFEKAVKALASTRDFQYDVYTTMMNLVYARATFPTSKKKTHSDIIPLLFEKANKDTYSQILSCCKYIGSEYKKIVNFLSYSLKNVYGLDCSTTYFDCTNFYFEIDKEDNFRRKGPSKEHRFDPIVSMGLLLDANQIPISMTMFAGNESEKPHLRNTLSQLKKENHISGRTIQVADKGLNCAHNIHCALKNNDGYLFSKSLKTLSIKDLQWFYSLNKDDWKCVYEISTNGESVIKYRYYSFVDKFNYSYIDDFGSKRTFTATEKRVITYSPALYMKKILELNKLISKAKNLCTFKAKKEEFGECAKYVKFHSTSKGKKTEDKVAVELNEELIEKERKLAGFNMLVTSEIKLQTRTIYNVYHNLWRIEQSFRIMKHYLDARPVYLSGEDSIKGHFLLCYINVVLERILEFNVLGGRFSHEKIMDFIRAFRVIRLSSKDYVNLLTSKNEVGQFLAETKYPVVTNSILTPSQITELMKATFKERIEEY